MHDDSPTFQPPRLSARGGATVTDLAKRRRSDDVLRSITLVFGGVNYGTVQVAASYTRGKAFAMYVVPAIDTSDGALTGSLDCLITDEMSLEAGCEVAR